MSLPYSDPDWWESGTNQNSVPANNNALRFMVSVKNGVADDVTAQPTLTSPADDGKWYILPAAATGAQWATFAEDSIAIFYGGGWYEFVPVEGDKVTVDGVIVTYESGAWVPFTVPASAAADDVSYDNSTSGLAATEVQAAIDELAAAAPGGDRSTVTAVTPASGTATFDYSLGDYFTLAPTANVTTLAFSNLPGAGHGASLIVRFTQDATPRTVAWPASFKWAGGTVPAVSTGSGAEDLLALTTFDNGTTWRATLSKAWA